jgi:hypothetical protein
VKLTPKQEAYLAALVYRQRRRSPDHELEAHGFQLATSIPTGPYGDLWSTYVETALAAPSILGALRRLGLAERRYRTANPWESPTPVWRLSRQGARLAIELGL